MKDKSTKRSKLMLNDNLIKTKFVPHISGLIDIKNKNAVNYDIYCVTIKNLQDFFRYSRNAVHQNIQNKIPYVYIPLNNLTVREAFFQKDIKKIKNNKTIFFKIDDVQKYFNDNFKPFIKTKRIDIDNLFFKKNYKKVEQLFALYRNPKTDEDVISSRRKIINLGKNKKARSIIYEIFRFQSLAYDEDGKYQKYLNVDHTTNFPDYKTHYNLDIAAELEKTLKYPDEPTFKTTKDFDYPVQGTRYFIRSGAIRFINQGLTAEGKPQKKPKVLYYIKPYKTKYKELEDYLTLPVEIYNDITQKGK